jgi:flagellar basal-body rod protein FlgF
MIKGLYTSAMGMLVQEAEMNVTTNNLANVGTRAFKRDRITFEEFPHLLDQRLYDTKLAPGQKHYLPPQIGYLGTGVIQDRITTDHEGGGIIETENRTDFTLDGKSFFMLETPQGLRFTRNGKFRVDGEGFLVTEQGHKVLGTEKPFLPHQPLTFEGKNPKEFIPHERIKPIKINDPKHFEVNLKGFINNTDERFVRVVVKNTNSLEKEGYNVFKLIDSEGLNDTKNAIRQRFLENSNVNVVQEMVHMIRVSKAYEANSKILTSIDQVIGQTVRQLGTLR